MLHLSRKKDECGTRHIVKMFEGGTDAASNLQMYHHNCRRNYYAEIDVVWPGV